MRDNYYWNGFKLKKCKSKHAVKKIHKPKPIIKKFDDSTKYPIKGYVNDGYYHFEVLFTSSRVGTVVKVFEDNESSTTLGNFEGSWNMSFFNIKLETKKIGGKLV